MTPEELGFQKVAVPTARLLDYCYYAHTFGDHFEVALEPLSMGRYYLAVYQRGILMGQKQLVRIHTSGQLLQVMGEDDEE